MTEDETAELNRRWAELFDASQDRMNADRRELAARQHWNEYRNAMIAKYVDETEGGLS